MRDLVRNRGIGMGDADETRAFTWAALPDLAALERGVVLDARPPERKRGFAAVFFDGCVKGVTVAVPTRSGGLGDAA